MVDEATKQEAREQATEVAHTARDQAGQVAGTVKEQAAHVADEVKQQGRQMVDRTKERMREQGDSQARQMAQSLRTLADEGRALADGRPLEAGPVTDYVRQASDRIQGMSQRVEERGAQGMVEDLENFGRRRPGMFLAGAAVAGFVVGRLVRSAASASQDANSMRSTGSTGYGYAGTTGTTGMSGGPGYAGTASGWEPDQTVPVPAAGGYTGNGG
jgi:ElaB/YqjD/DUF883 family membrane-anchored ribosome-binding protein